MYNLGDIVITKKPHACGCNKWEIVRTGADIKIKCTACGRIVMMDTDKFKKSIKTINSPDNEDRVKQ